MIRMSDSVGLPLSLLTANLFNFVVAKRCESEDGRSSKMCDDDEACCETNGEVSCCNGLGIGTIEFNPYCEYEESWGVIIALVVMAIIIVTGGFCCYCCWKISRKNGGCNSSFNNDFFQDTRTRTHVVVQRSPSVAQRSPSVAGTVRTVTVQPSGGVVRLVKLPSSVNSHSNTNNTEPPPTEPPPPYSNTDAPPSYFEIDL